MGRFEESKEEKSSSKGPHPDHVLNYKDLSDCIEKYHIIDPEIFTYEISKDFGTEIPLCARFMFGPTGRRSGGYSISFHQARSEFKKELCTVFANLCKMGILK